MRSSRTLRSTKLFTFFSLAIVAVSSVALAAPNVVQSNGSDTLSTTLPAPDSLPPSMQSSVQVMVEMTDAPAAIAWAAALKQAQAELCFAASNPQDFASLAEKDAATGPDQFD